MGQIKTLNRFETKFFPLISVSVKNDNLKNNDSHPVQRVFQAKTFKRHQVEVSLQKKLKNETRDDIVLPHSEIVVSKTNQTIKNDTKFKAKKIHNQKETEESKEAYR